MTHCAQCGTARSMSERMSVASDYCLACDRGGWLVSLRMTGRAVRAWLARRRRPRPAPHTPDCATVIWSGLAACDCTPKETNDA